MKKTFLFLLMMSLLCGCGSLHIEKKRHSNGFYVNWSKSFNSQKSDQLMEKSLARQQAESSNAKIESDSSVATNSVRNTLDEKLSSTSSSTIQTSFHKRNVLLKPVNTKAKTISSYFPQAVESKQEALTRHELRSKKESRKISGAWFYALFTSLPFFYLFKKRTSKLANWATLNKKKSQGILAILSATGATSSFTLGSLLGSEIDSALTFMSMGTFGLSIILHSIKLPEGANFLKVKTSYALMGTTGFSAAFGLGSNYGQTIFNAQNSIDGEMILHPALAVFLTLILLLVMFAALYLIAGLSCTLACNGSVVLAFTVLIAGVFSVLVLTILAIQYLFKREGKESNSFLRKAILSTLILMALIILLLLVL